MKKEDFPLESLVPQIGTMTWNNFGASLDIPLEPFELPFAGKVETRILIDCLPFEQGNAASLIGLSLEFPADYRPERPEGSIYIEHAHHPVDLTAISLRAAEGDEIEADLAVRFAFNFEGLAASEDSEYEDTDWRFTARIIVRTPSTIH